MPGRLKGNPPDQPNYQILTYIIEYQLKIVW